MPFHKALVPLACDTCDTCDASQGCDESYFIKKSHVACMRLFYEVSLRRIPATSHVSHASGTRALVKGENGVEGGKDKKQR